MIMFRRAEKSEIITIFRQPYREEMEVGECGLVYVGGRVAAIWSVDRTVYMALSADGENWSQPERISLERDKVECLTAQAHRKQVHLAWQTERAMRYCRSLDGGRQWKKPITLHQRARTEPERDELSGFSCWGNNLAVGWSVSTLSDIENPVDPRPPFGMRSEDAGETWKPLNTLVPNGMTVLSEDIFVGNIRGTEWRSNDRGRNWKPILEINRPKPPEISQSRWLTWGDTVFTLWIVSQRLIFRRSEDNGRTWIAEHPILLEQPINALFGFSHYEGAMAAIYQLENGWGMVKSINGGSVFEKVHLNLPVEERIGFPAIANHQRSAFLCWWQRSEYDLKLQSIKFPIR